MNKEEKKEYQRQWRLDHPEYSKQYYNNHKVEENERRKKYSQDHKEEERERNKKYRQDNSEKIKAGKKKYRLNNKDKINAYDRKYCLNHKEEEKERKKRYRLSHREERKVYRLLYYLKHSDEIKAYSVKYNQIHPEYKKQWNIDHPKYSKKYGQEHKKERNELLRNRFRIDLKFNLNSKMSSMIWHSLRKNKAGNRWEDLVGYTLVNLINKLKKTIPEGYTFKDCLNGKLHIDHILPISLFQFKTPEDNEFKQCWSLHNLRLLPAEENLIKHDNITNPILLGLLLNQ